MDNKQTLLRLVEHYLKQYPQESESVQSLQRFLLENNDGELYMRTNFNGHITASAFILNRAMDALLLLKHKKLNRWLQPGGHVDKTDKSLLAAAQRETEEETGLKLQHLHVVPFPNTNGLFDIDSHDIPANTSKNEPGHVHHDMRFLFICLNEELLNVNTSEAVGFKWVPLSELYIDETFKDVAKKIIAYLKTTSSTKLQ